MTCATGQSYIQAEIWRGYSESARILGSDYQFYRPEFSKLELEDGSDLQLEDGSSLNLEGPRNFPGNPLFTRPVSLNAEDMNYRRPNKYGKATWYALVDGKDLRVGDYFIGLSPDGDILLEDGTPLELEDGEPLELEGLPQGTYFIAAMQPLLPILVVECNRVISISRPQAQTGKGAQDYSGMTAANEKTFVTGVPCSILQGTKGEKNAADLPGDVRSPWWTILTPSSVGRIRTSDLIIDDLGQRYVVSSNELTDLGYRLTAMMADA